MPLRVPPKWDDTETSLGDLKARIARTVAFVEGFAPTRFEGADARIVEIKIRTETVRLSGLDYLTKMALPNFFFHLTMGYAALRAAGVPLGKADFDGIHSYPADFRF